MGYGPNLPTDEKPAQKIIEKTALTISRLLIVIGKPFFIFFWILLVAITLVFNITGRIMAPFVEDIGKILPKKRLKESGVIYTSPKTKVEHFLRILRIKFQKLIGVTNEASQTILDKSGKFFWNLEVFFLALHKVFSRFWAFLTTRISEFKLGERIFFLILKLRLKLFQLYTSLPRPSFPKVSKLKILGVFLLFVFILTFTAGVVFWQFILKDLPAPNELKQKGLEVSTKIYDRNGILLYTVFKDQNRTPVSLDDIPKQVKLATIAIEDASFYSHPGFSIRGIARAFLENIKQRDLSGGSTITQQLVKNRLLSPEKTFVRKIREIVLSMQVEMTFSKDEILEMYLNEVSYGGTAYGIQEAARTYFGKDVDKLSLGEAAYLSGLPKSPTRYSPYGANPEVAIARQREVLRLMRQNDFISEEQLEGTEGEELKFAQNKIDIKAPHFVFYVRENLEEKWGREFVETAGLEVKTTLDYKIQSLAEDVLKLEVAKLKNLNVTNGAVVVLTPKTGEILAMVGSIDFFDQSIDGNVNVTTRERQPGSSIKVVNYAYALSHGYTPATIIKDTPVSFLVDGQPRYTPKNYEGEYRGDLTLRSALAESRNIPAVRVLASYGVANMMEMGKNLGITTWEDTSAYGLSLTLGGGEVKLIDLARVYATFANLGRKPPLTSVLKVTDYVGRTHDENGCGDECGEQVLDPRISFIITDILKDNEARAPSFGSNSLLVIPKHKEVAVKTGTSNDLRDNLAIGYNQNYVVAVWVGNNDNSQMERIASGVTGATPIFNRIMTALLEKSENHDWEVPKGLIKIPICPLTGTLACEGCPTKLEWFLEENKPQTYCSPGWFKQEEEQKDEERDATAEASLSDEVTPGQILDPAWESEVIDLQRIIRKKRRIFQDH